MEVDNMEIKEKIELLEELHKLPEKNNGKFIL